MSKFGSLFLANLILVPLSVSARATADDWTQWRGPTANGVAVGDRYPVKWSATENVVWKCALPGLGASTPIVKGDNIFLTCSKKGRNTALCINRSGKQLWEVDLGKETPAKNNKASGCNSSAVTDGTFVFVYFKSGDFACLDFAGKVIWQKNLQSLYGPDTLWWDLGTSPVLTKDFVVVACMQTGPSYLVAFEKASGKEAWKHDRKLDAPSESAQSYTTPLVIQQQDSEVIVVLGADHVTAHDAATGKQLWIAGNLNPSRIRNYRSIASPVVSDGYVIAPYSRGATLTAVRLGGSGDVTKTHVAWVVKGVAADVPTPVACSGRVYTCTDRGKLSVLDIESGKTLMDAQAPRSTSVFSASPVLAGGHVYITNESGTTYVFKLGASLELVAQNTIDIFTIATPVFCDSRIYLRNDEFLFCIGDTTATRSAGE